MLMMENKVSSWLGSGQSFHKLVTESNNHKRKKIDKFLDFLKIKIFCISKDTNLKNE